MTEPSPPQATSQPAAPQIESLVGLINSSKFTEAVTQARAMTEGFPDFWLGWGILGMALQKLGRGVEALAPTQRAVRLMPDNAGMHLNLGTVFHDLGQLQDAEASYRQALQLDPAYIQAHINLGSVLLESGRANDAETALRHALQAAPGHPQLHYNLGAALAAQGRLQEAEASYRSAIHLDPRHADAHLNLAAALQSLGRLKEAEESYRAALAIAPNHVHALNNLALLLDAQGKPEQALELARRAFRYSASEETKRTIATCLKHLPVDSFNAVLQSYLVNALTEPWINPSELARTAISVLKLTPQVAACMNANKPLEPNPFLPPCRGSYPLGWKARMGVESGNSNISPPSLPLPLQGGGNTAAPNGLSGMNAPQGASLPAIPGDALLCALLESTLICDAGMERFLTRARRMLLDSTTSSAAPQVDQHFACALARQCFVNEYVFACDADEFAQACAARDALSAALESGAAVSVPLLLAVACYFPLHPLPHINNVLALEWPLPVQEMLIVQMVGPEMERVLRETIPQLTPIEGEVSLLVQAQYEENPYPSWVKLPDVRAAASIPAYLRQRFPLAPFRARPASSPEDILIAGCGTGQHAIHAARRSKNARVLAIDLSLRSLCYAKRKALEYDLENIEFAQADLLQLASLTRRFDVIESSGVLHHLADPWQGWRVLLSLLQPGGFMKLGFYSELGRRDIVRIREHIAEKGYTASAQDIRRCRQELMAAGDEEGYGNVLRSPDFYSVSACRDLLFHVQEHRMTWPEIAAFIKDNGLQLIGLEVGQDVLAAYRERFPDDLSALDLHNWHQFETDHPDTFAGMYQFWVQKT